MRGLAQALVPEPPPLVDTKAVLFIDDAHKLAGRKLQIARQCVLASRVFVIAASEEQRLPPNLRIVLLNNVSSFSRSRERAGEFGDTILSVDVPLSKLAFFSELLPGMLKAEDEYVVIGGLYRVRLATM